MRIRRSSGDSQRRQRECSQTPLVRASAPRRPHVHACESSPALSPPPQPSGCRSARWHRHRPHRRRRRRNPPSTSTSSRSTTSTAASSRPAPSGGIAALERGQGVPCRNPNTVFAAAGDLIGASTFESFIQQDKPTIDALNAGRPRRQRGRQPRVRPGLRRPDRPGACRGATGSTSAPTSTKGHHRTPALARVLDRRKFRGVTDRLRRRRHRELPSLVSPAGIAESRWRPGRGANRVAASSATARGQRRGDIVVLLVHEGAADDRRSLGNRPDHGVRRDRQRRRPNIDAIVSGHTHLAYNHVIDGRPVISSGQYGERFDRWISADRGRPRRSPMKNDPLPMDGTDAAAYAVPSTRRDADRGRRRGVANVLGNVVLGATREAFNRAQRPRTVKRRPPREPRRRVDARQPRRRRAALGAQRGRQAAASRSRS